MSTPHEHRLRVRYAETDQMGRVHHANYVLYLEEARTRMMAERGCSYAELERTGVGLVVRTVELRYRAAAGYDEELIVRTRVERMRGASIQLAYEIERAADGVLVAAGTTELGCVDLTAQPARPRPLPDAVREAMA